MRVAVTVGVLVVLAVVGHPTGDRALDRHRAENRQRDLHGAVRLEGLVGEQPVVADGDSVEGQRVHHERDEYVAPGQPGGGWLGWSDIIRDVRADPTESPSATTALYPQGLQTKPRRAILRSMVMERVTVSHRKHHKYSEP